MGIAASSLEQREADVLNELARKSPIRSALVDSLTRSTAWHRSAARGWVRAIRTLNASERGSSTSRLGLNSRDGDGRSPLLVASRAGHVDAVTVLLELGADLWVVDAKQRSALHHAARHGHAQVASQLIAAAGRDTRRFVDMRDASGFSALHYAAQSGNTDVAQILLTAGATLHLHNTRPGTGWLKNAPVRSNALHLAAAAGHIFVCKAIVQAYLDRPTNVQHPDPRLLRDANGHQPYMVAGNCGMWHCAQLLLLISRDETHAYWHAYMHLPGDHVRAKVPTLASLAQTAWLAHLETQVSSLVARGSYSGGSSAVPQASTPPASIHSHTPQPSPAVALAPPRHVASLRGLLAGSNPPSTGGECCAAGDDELIDGALWFTPGANPLMGALTHAASSGGIRAGWPGVPRAFSSGCMPGAPRLSGPSSTAAAAVLAAAAAAVARAEAGPTMSAPGGLQVFRERMDSAADTIPDSTSTPEVSPAAAEEAPQESDQSASTQAACDDAMPPPSAAADTVPVLTCETSQAGTFTGSDGGCSQCELCFERPALLRVQLCGHTMCASCSTRVVKLAGGRTKPGARGAPLCPWCQQFILGFQLASDPPLRPVEAPLE